MAVSLDVIKEISRKTPSKIVLVSLDGLGGLPDPDTGKTELETARTPNLDRLAGKGICGLADPVSAGITPGSGPGHLALFGYDPVSCNIGRGVLEALGIDFDLQPEDVAARGNFCTLDSLGIITDRRAGRIPSEKSAELTSLMDGMEINKVKVLVRPVREHRFVVVFRGKGLNPDVTNSDPQQTGVAPNRIQAIHATARATANIANEFVERAGDILSQHQPANSLLLRGFSQHPVLPSMAEIYKLNPAAIAGYPMYRGLARLAGMTVLKTGPTIQDQMATLKEHYNDYDFFFLHVKGTDSAGEDGDFARKVSVIEQTDQALTELTSLQPDVIVVTGDHSTPALLRGHSWHPVPVLLYSKWCRTDGVTKFGESGCRSGGLGRFPAREILPLAMAHALKLTKFGA